MHKTYSASPKKFGSHTSTFKKTAHHSFGGKPARPAFGPARNATHSVAGGGARKFSNNSKPSFRKGGSSSYRQGGASKRSRGERIDFSRFIKKNVYVEEKPYVSKHSFADFPFNPQLQKNIERAGFTNPRPIQDQAITSVMKGLDVFGMALI